jgi:hypothetical protein
MADLHTINYKDWTFDVDQTLTKTLYSNIMWGRADAIPTKEFKNYSAQRDYLFPKEILELFDTLGVDYKKELKIKHYPEDDGLNSYCGTFYIVGDMIKGDSCKIDLGDNHCIVELTPITENFSIGFYQDKHEILHQHLIFIEFSVTVPYDIGVKVQAS